MLTRHYKDYVIVVSAIDTNIGTGFRASFYVPKMDGLKACHQMYETYRRKRPPEVGEDVKRIIAALGV